MWWTPHRICEYEDVIHIPGEGAGIEWFALQSVLDPIGRPEYCLYVLLSKSKYVLVTMTNKSWWVSEVVSPKQCRSDEVIHSVIKLTAGRTSTKVQ